MGQLTYVIINRNQHVLLEMLMAQLTIDANVVIVDDASTDDSSAMVQSKYADVKLVCHSRRMGPTAARLSGLSYVDTPYVLFLDSDVTLNHWSEKQAVQFFDFHPQTAAFGPAVLVPSGDRMWWSCSIDPNPWTECSLITVYNTAKRVHLPRLASWARSKIAPWNATDSIQVDWVSGAGMCFRTSVIRAITFDRTYIMGYEEADVCRRIRNAGWQVWFVPSLSIVHHGGDSGISPVRRVSERTDGRHRYLRQHHPVAGRLGEALLANHLSRQYSDSDILAAR